MKFKLVFFKCKHPSPSYQSLSLDLLFTQKKIIELKTPIYTIKSDYIIGLSTILIKQFVSSIWNGIYAP